MVASLTKISFVCADLAEAFCGGGQLVLGTEGLGLQDVVLPNGAPIALVADKQHGHLARAEVSLKGKCQEVDSVVGEADS